MRMGEHRLKDHWANKRNKNGALIDKLRVNASRLGCREIRARIRTPSELRFYEVPYRPYGEMRPKNLTFTPSLSTKDHFLLRFVPPPRKSGQVEQKCHGELFHLA